MKIPLTLQDQPRELDKQSLNRLLESDNFMADFLEVLQNPQDSIHKSPRLLLDRLDSIAEEQINQLKTEPLLELNTLLSLYLKISEFESYCKLFYQVEHLLAILEYSDRINTYSLVMQILLRLFSKQKSNQKYLNEFVPRVVYLCRFFFDHSNSLSDQRMELYDYYYDDPIFKGEKYQRSTLVQFMTPTLLLEPYEDLLKNQVHKLSLQQPPEQHQFQIETALQRKPNCASYRELSQQLIEAAQLKYSFCPLAELLKYKMLFFNHRDEVVELHLLALEVYLSLDQFCNDSPQQQDFLDTVFTEKIDFAHYFQVYGKLFQLQSTSAQFLENVIRTFEGILTFDSMPEQDECFNIAKEYDETFLQLILDVLSQTPTMISPQAAKCPKVACRTLKLFSSEAGVALLSRNTITVGTSQAIIKALKQGSNLTLSPEVLRAAIKLLGRLSRKDDALFIDEILKMTESYLDLSRTSIYFNDIEITDAELLVSQCIQAINEHFKDEEGRRPRNNRVNAPNVARKVSETQILKQIHELLHIWDMKAFPPFLQQSLMLVSHISNEVPTLIGRIMESKLPADLISLIQRWEIRNVNGKQVEALFSFLSNITLKEEGFDAFNPIAMELFHNVLVRLITTQNTSQESLNVLASQFYKYVHKIDKSSALLLKTLMAALNNILEQLKQCKFDLNNYLIESKLQFAQEQFIMMQHILQNLSVFLTRITQVQQTHMSILHDLAHDGFVALLCQFLQFPNFEPRNDLLRAFKALSQFDDTMIASNLLGLLGQQLSRVQVPVIADLSKYFNQQRDNFNKVCDYQYLEQLIEALKLTVNIESHFEKTLLRNTMGQLANRFIDFLPHIQETFTSVEQVQKNRIVNTLSSMKSVIMAVYRQQKQQWNPDDCKDLVRIMTVLAEKMKGDASTMLVNSYLLKDISQTLVQGHRSGENGAIWVELYTQLIEAEFYNYAKAALGAFYQKLTRDEPLLDVIAQQFTRIVGNLYATKIEIKKGTPRDSALKVISQLVDELSYLVHICYDVEKECQQCLVEVLLSKCESLIQYKDLIVDSQILRQSHMEDEDLENASEVVHHLVQLGYTQEQAQNAIDEIEEPELELALQYLQSQPLIKPSVAAEVESDRDREIKYKFAQLRTLFNRYLLYFRHFDDKLHKLIDATSILPQLLKALKSVATPFIKLKFRDVDLTIAIPERNGLIPIILSHINRLSDRDFDHHELIRLLQELVKMKEDQSQSVTLILAMYHSSINNEELKKQRKKSKSENIADHFAEALVVINQTLRSTHTNSLNVRIATDVLVKILSLNTSYITQWVITLKGMDALLRQKGDDSNTVNVLSKLVFEITQDQTLQRAQLQCKIKRLLYDQEYNLEVEKEKEPVKSTEKPHMEKQHPYPQVYQTLYHAVNLNELKIQKDAKELQGYLEEDLQFVVSKIFDEVTETVDEKPIVYYKLKPTSNLHTLEGVAPQYFIKYQPEQKKQSLSKKTVQLTQSNFQHTPEFQIMIKGLIQQIIVSFLDQEKYQFHWFSILQVLHVLIRKYPLLIPKIMKVNCSKYCNEPKVLEALHVTELPKISFLTFLVKVMIPSTQDKLKNFMFELCLDNVLLGQQSPTLITPFSAEIRKKILTEVYDQLEQEFKRNLFQSPTNSLAVASYSNMLIHLLQIKSVCRLAFRNVLDPQGSLNFIKLFMEAFKSLSLVGFYNYDKLLDFITETLGVLYSVGIYNLTHNKPQKNPSSPNDGQPGQLRAEEIQHQVIPRQQIIYKDSAKVFDTWPYPPLAFACNRRDDIPDNYGFELQFIRGQNPLIHMQRNHRRPRGVVIDPLDGEDGEFLAVDSEMIQELHDPDQNSQQEQSFEEEGESQSQSQSQSEQHEGDSWVTSSNQSGQIQEEGSGSDSWTDEDEDEEGNEQMEEESNEDDQNESGDDDNDDDNEDDDEEDDLGSASGDEMDIDIDASLSGPVLIQKALPKEDQAYVKTIKTIVLFENIKFPTEFVRILDTLKEVFSVQFTEITTPTEIFITNWQSEFNKPSEEKPAPSRFPHYFSHHFSHNSRINDLMRVTDLNRHRIFQPRQLLQTRIYNHAQQPLDNNAQQLQNQLLQLDWNTLLQNSVPQLAPQQPPVPPLNPLPEPFPANLPNFQMPDFSGLLQQPAQGEFQNIFRNSPLNRQQQQQQQLDRIQMYSQSAQMHEILQLEQQEEQRRNQLRQQEQQLLQQQQQLLAQQQQLLNQQQQLQQQQQQIQQLQPQQQQQQEQQQQSLNSLFERQVQQQQIQLQDLQIQERDQQIQQQASQMQEEVVVQQNQDQMQIEQPYPRTMELLSRLGRPVSQLTENGFDLEAFEQLPEDLQMDVIFSLPNQVENTNGIDIEFLNSLPHDIQLELQQQQRQPQNTNPADDLLAFIQTLAPGLREEVLLTASNDVVEQLPQQIREEVMEIRMRANTREIYRLERTQYQQQPPQQQQQQQQLQQKAKKENQNLLKVKELLLKDKHLNHKLGTVDDEFAEALLNLLYLEAHTFVYFPINLFITLTNNPLVEAKIIDAMFFILRTKKDMPALKQSSNLREDQFPLTYIVERHGVMRDYARCYQIVSLKILYLLSKMQNISSSYFYEQRKISALSSIAKLSQEQQVVPIFQLIYLLPEFKGVHQDLLIDAISNLTRVKSDLQLNERCIQCMCQMLLQSQNRMKQFSTIISNLCSQESNLILFFQSIKEIIQNVTTEINQSFQASQDIDKIFLPEKSLINIFLFIKEQLERDVPTVKKQFQELLDDSSLQQLWKNLSEILCSISSDQVARQSSKIAPYLECFFIIYQMLNPQTDLKKRYVKKETKTKIATMEIQEQVQNNDELFQQICERGKVLLNMMIKEKLVESRNTGKNFLQEPLGIVFLKAPKIIDFENKQKYFKLELKQLKQQNRHSAHGTINLRIRRKDIFMDSYNKFSTYQPDRLKGKLQIEFVGEEGIDAGGVLREWFLVLSREIFNPNYALFTPSLNGQMFQPSNKSYINHEHIKYFKFIGRIVGKALYDGQLLDTYFTRSFYKHILGQTLTIHDMEDIDLNEYNSMKKILENNIDDWGIYWTYNVDNFGRIEERELVEGGKSKSVTDENKVEYVQTYCYQKMAKEIKDQIEAFLSGFQELIPQHIISIFEWKEMELMLCGLPDIDCILIIYVVDDMKENVEYHGLTSQDKIVQWLWELLESYDKSKRASYLQFVTGTSKVPLGGFKELRGMHGPQKMQIHKKPYRNYELPTSHTCFNQLDLPDYPTRQILKEKLELAILEGKEGFGFG